MARSPLQSVMASGLAAALLGGGLVVASAVPASAADATFSVTVSPALSGANLVVSLRDSNGWENTRSNNQTDVNGSASMTINDGYGSTYVMAVSPPPNVSDDSAPYLETGSTASVTRNVVFPTKNITYTVQGPNGPVPNVYVQISRPYFEYGDRRGATPIVGGTVNSASKFFLKLQDGNSLVDSYPGVGWQVSINPPANSGLAPMTFDDSWNGQPTVNRTITIQQANVRALVTDPQGNKYREANVTLEGLPTPQNNCWPQRIASAQVGSQWAQGADDTFNGYTDPSLTPGGYRIVLEPRGDDTTAIRTEHIFDIDDTSTDLIRTLAFQAPNVVATVLNPSGSPIANAGVSVNLHPSNQSRCFNRYVQSQSDGKAYLRLSSDDTYRITVQPPSNTGFLSRSFIVPGSSLSSGQITLQLANANISGIVKNSSGANLAGARITFQALSAEGWLNDWLGEVDANNSGAFQFYVDPALVPFGLAVTARDPNGWSSGAATRLTLAANELPALNRTIQLNPVNFAGQIIGSNGQPLSNAWVNARTSVGVDAGSVNTDSNGQFAMYVPGTVSVSSPLNLGVWIQSDQRYVQRQVTQLSTNFSWQIPAVNLGVVVTANGSPAAGAQVSLFRFNGAYDEWIDGGQTGQDGVARFAVDDTTVEYSVEVQPGPGQFGFATAKVTGIPQPLGNGTARLNVALAQPNAAVLVEAPIGSNGAMVPLQDAFVYVQRLDGFTGTGAMTSGDGLARLVLDDTTGVFGIYVSPPYYMRSELTEGRVETELQVVNGIASAKVQLASPNVGLFIRVPGTSDTPLSYAQVEVRNAGDSWGFNWAGADEQGGLGLTLDPGEYELVVRPPSWLSGMSGFGSRTYWMSIDGDDDVSVRIGSSTGTPAPFNQQYGVFVLEPSVATYSAAVELPTNPAQVVANSWVEVLREVKNGPDTWYEWVEGASTGRDGTFGLTLKDDTYVLIAQPVWGDRTYAPSAPCYLVVTGGQNATSSSGLPAQCDDTLTLRSPNLVFTVRNPSDNSAVANAWICPLNTFSTTCVASGRDGRATFFIDDTPSIPNGKLRLQIEAPWGSTGLAGRTVEIPVASVGSASWTNGSQSVLLARPNVTISAWRDDSGVAGNEALEGWVSVFQDDDTFTWIGGSAVNRQGRALFSIDDTSGTFCIDAWPGWGLRKDYGPIQRCGVSLSSGSLDLIFKTANVRTTVLDADGRTNAYGWVEISGANNARSGAPLDDRGRLATYLGDGSYTLTFYPAWQRSGTPTTVSVTVTGGVANIASQVTLAEGNVRGQVTIGGAPVAGIVIVATPTGSGTAVATVSDASGAFRMSLPSGSYTLETLAPPGTSGARTVTITSGGTLVGSTLSVGS